MLDTLDITAIELAEAHRHAYNAAFEDVGLNWYWDCATYSGLRAQGPDPVRTYLESEYAHLLRAYDADFLVNAVEAAKVQRLALAASRRASTRAADFGGRLAEAAHTLA